MTEAVIQRREAPTSTYRLQITPQFDLYAAAKLLPHLHDLGTDWVYLSPILAAEPGSEHGYDVVAHDRVDPARGGPDGLRALADAAHRQGMGVLVDIVPNHMGVASAPQNPWWWELLRDGPGSAAAERFDVDWAAGDGKLLVPVLGDDVDAVEVVDGEVRYHEHRFPMAPGTSTLEEQHYALVSWRRADSELNYRRFFTVTTLAGIRVEDPQVFADSHVEIRRWFDQGLVDGLRVDHPDGLLDPADYLVALADLTGGAYVLVEKILEPGEELDPSWSCAGTTGYDAMAWIDRVLVDPSGEAALAALAQSFGEPADFHELVHDTKRTVADTSLRAEVRRIGRDAGDPGLDDALAELLACFPVYRSYLPEGREHLDSAFAQARRRRPDLAAALDRLTPILLDPSHPAAQRFQQTSGMVMAKGVEDCAFYRYSRLTSLNEVGGDPALFAVAPEQLHGWAARRQHEWPQAMSASTTHDTKRSEDVRARISVLAELPDDWAAFLDRLEQSAPMPDRGFANLVWQAAVGAWPISAERLHAYAEKAMREAGTHTSWTAPAEDFEAAVHGAIDAAYRSSELGDFAARLADPGWSNALAAKLLTLTLPGVPDVYQGTELWQQTLVDPDNRHPVDFDRARALAGDSVLCGGLDDPGGAKLAVTRTALRWRRERPDLFEGYAALAAEGVATEHCLAFDRGGAITVVTRLPVGLATRGGWGDTVLRLPTGSWRNVLGSFPGYEGNPVLHPPHNLGEEPERVPNLGNRIPLADLLADLPVALLVRDR